MRGEHGKEGEDGGKITVLPNLYCSPYVNKKIQRDCGMDEVNVVVQQFRLQLGASSSHTRGLA